jgi:hypothetical protein
MPFKSKAQERAAFGGYLGKEMEHDAKEWAKKTDQKDLPNHVKGRNEKTKALERHKDHYGRRIPPHKNPMRRVNLRKENP